MELISILRVLWLRRLWVVVGFVVAVYVGVAVSYEVHLGVPPDLESRQYNGGIASASVLIDSTSSQVADLGDAEQTGPQADVSSLSARARLLASLMATSPLKDEIAELAGVPPGRLVARAPGDGVAAAPVPLTSAEASLAGEQPNVLTISVNETLPILLVDSEAPTAAAAARIASAAVAALEPYLQSVATGDRVPSARRLVITPLGPAKYATVTHGPTALLSLLAALVAFAAWCAAIVAVDRLAGVWREATATDAITAPPPPPEPSAEPRLRKPPGHGFRRGRRDPATLAAGAGQESTPEPAPTGDEPTMPTHAVNV